MRPIKLICRSPAFKTGSFAKSPTPCRRKDARCSRIILLCKEKNEKKMQKILRALFLSQTERCWQSRSGSADDCKGKGRPEKFPDGAAVRRLRRARSRLATPAATPRKQGSGWTARPVCDPAGIRAGAKLVIGRPPVLRPAEAICVSFELNFPGLPVIRNGFKDRGVWCGNRTRDLYISSVVLYRLS